MTTVSSANHQVVRPVSEQDRRWPVSVYGEEQDGCRHMEEDRGAGGL